MVQGTGSVTRDLDSLCSWHCPGCGCPSYVHRRPIHTSKTGKITTESNCGSSESQEQNVKGSDFLLGESQEILLPEPGGPTHPSPSVRNVGQSSLGSLCAAGIRGKSWAQGLDQKPSSEGAGRRALALACPLTKTPLSTGHCALSHPRSKHTGCWVHKLECWASSPFYSGFGLFMCSYRHSQEERPRNRSSR